MRGWKPRIQRHTQDRTLRVSMRGWKPRELWVEALRNLGSRQVGVGLLAALVLAAMGVLSGTQALQVIDQVRAANLAGALVWQASASPESPLDGGRCERLNWSEGVAAAGGIYAEEPELVIPLTHPVRVPSRSVTPRVLRVWERAAPTGGMVVGTDLEELGVATVGSTIIDSDSGTASVVGARTPDAVRPGVLRSNVLLIASPDAQLSDCWLRMAPGASAWGGDLLTAAFGLDPGVRVVPYVSVSETTFTPLQQWLAFAGLRVWASGGAAVGILLSLSIWMRRGEFAVYRVFGAHRSEVGFLAAAESGLVLAPAALMGTIVALTTCAVVNGGPVGADVVEVIVRTVVAAAATAYAVSVPVTALVLRGSVTGGLRDR